MAAERDDGHHERSGVDNRQSAENAEAGAIPKEIHGRKAREQDCHHAQEDNGYNEYKSSDQAALFLLQLESEQFDAILGTCEQVVAECPKRTSKAGRTGCGHVDDVTAYLLRRPRSNPTSRPTPAAIARDW